MDFLSKFLVCSRFYIYHVNTRLREPREAKIDLSQDAECCLDMLKLGKEGDALPCYTSNPLSHAPHTAGNPHPSAVLHDLMSSTATMISSAADTELVNSSKNQHEQDVKDSPKEEKKYMPKANQLLFFFQHFESYVGHLKEHRQYFCLVCGKVFSQKNNLTHIGIHTGFKPFRCPLCHMTFTQKAMLQHHFNLHTWEEAP
uniref:C2H2-type domain-containing protein n=1 Tax=Maylandia zebra TaxID=106582 RepID=A0A3P9CLM4_9CICH